MSEFKYVEIIGDDSFTRIIFWVILKSIIFFTLISYFNIKSEYIHWLTVAAILLHTYFNSKKRVIFYEDELFVYKRNWLTLGTYIHIIPKNKVHSITSNYGIFSHYLNSITIHYKYIFFTKISFYSGENETGPMSINCKINSSSRIELKIPFAIEHDDSGKFRAVASSIMLELKQLGYNTKL